jgi:hypothetical protein
MTIFGWDTSHYDGDLTRAILTRAKAEGIEFWTHKLGEGLDNTDPKAAAAFAAGQGVFEVIGGYYFIHHGQDMHAQAARCIAVADQVAPWWRDFNGWFWQTDAETESPYGLPTPSEVKTFADTLAAATGRTVMVYASAGQYGDRLAGLGHPLWNAHYGTNPAGGFKAIYPGDDSAGWHAYSGQTPALLQYGSKATIAGLTTCDANAYRGSLDELLALIGGDMPLTGADGQTVWNTDTIPNPRQRADSPGHTPPGDNPTTQADFALGDVWQQVYDLRDAVAAQGKQLAELAAAVAKIPTEPAAGGGVTVVDGTFTGTVHSGPAEPGP